MEPRPAQERPPPPREKPGDPRAGTAPSPSLPDLLPDSAVLPVWLRAAFAVGGCLLLVLGVVVWLVPVVGGAVVFCLAGLLLLGRSSRRVRQAVNRAERRLPAPARRALRLGRRTRPRTG